jgi:hypothetical protein
MSDEVIGAAFEKNASLEENSTAPTEKGGSPLPEQKVVEPVADRVAKIRQELRDGRQRNRQAGNGTNQTGKPANKDVGTGTTENGSVLPEVRGQGAGIRTTNRGNSSTQRSTEEKSVRERSADRRLSENNRRANDPVSTTASANARVAGRLEASEPIPVRLPE